MPVDFSGITIEVGDRVISVYDTDSLDIGTVKEIINDDLVNVIFNHCPNNSTFKGNALEVLSNSRYDEIVRQHEHIIHPSNTDYETCNSVNLDHLTFAMRWVMEMETDAPFFTTQIVEKGEDV